ncbi:MAG: helix-hairpin-helix domain-containing protein [Promethearchaeota archaeon]
MFKTKGFSSNNSLKRRAIIVDAPDLPPEECEFYITSAGIADTDKIEIPEVSGLDFKVENLFENGDTQESNENPPNEIDLLKVKGIGKGTLDNLKAQGITNISQLLAADPEALSASISGASMKTITLWQQNAKALMNI